MAANVQDFAALRLRQRVLVDVRRRWPRATLAALRAIGVRRGGHGRAQGRGAAARAAHAAGVPFTLSTVGICPISEAAAAADVHRPGSSSTCCATVAPRALLDGAWAAGCRTLVFTVDLPLLGMRLRDIRHGMAASGARPALIRAAQAARPGWA
ncbi:MAG: alpha-hydroxy-acid oxidizing protein [Paenacidovorax caeni]